MTGTHDTHNRIKMLRSRNTSWSAASAKRKAFASAVTDRRRGRTLKEFDMTRVPVEILNEPLFWQKVQKTEACWIWTGYCTNLGYGAVQIRNRPFGAHRVSYSLRFGDIPDGKRIDHMCHTPSCVNPDHLRLATAAQNSQNRAGATRVNQTGVRGVEKTRSGRFRTHVKSQGNRYTAGTFDSLDEASEAVAQLRKRIMTHTQN